MIPPLFEIVMSCYLYFIIAKLICQKEKPFEIIAGLVRSFLDGLIDVQVPGCERRYPQIISFNMEPDIEDVT